MFLYARAEYALVFFQMRVDEIAVQYYRFNGGQIWILLFDNVSDPKHSFCLRPNMVTVVIWFYMLVHFQEPSLRYSLCAEFKLTLIHGSLGKRELHLCSK